MDLSKAIKALSRVTRTFRIEIGPLRAQGVPAVLVGVSGVIFAAGIANALSRNAGPLETLREARALALALRSGERTQLHS